MITCRDDGWLPAALEAVRIEGFAVVTDVLDDEFLDTTRIAMDRALRAVTEEVGHDRLVRAKHGEGFSLIGEAAVEGEDPHWSGDPVGGSKRGG